MEINFVQKSKGKQSLRTHFIKFKRNSKWIFVIAVTPLMHPDSIARKYNISADDAVYISADDAVYFINLAR